MIRCYSVDALLAHYAVHRGGLRRTDIVRALRDVRLLARGLATIEEIRAESERVGALVLALMPPLTEHADTPARGALP